MAAQVPDEVRRSPYIARSHIWSHGRVSQKLLKQSVNNLEAVYRDKGYEDAKITPLLAEHDPRIDVTFEIAEGEQTLVDSVKVTGNHGLDQNQLTAPRGFELKAGGPFSARQMSEDRNRISANYLERGYLNAEVKATVVRHGDDPHRVDVSYLITERPSCALATSFTSDSNTRNCH